MIWSKIRIQLISNNNTLCGIMILRRSSEKKKKKILSWVAKQRHKGSYTHVKMLSTHVFLSSHNGTYIAKTNGVTAGQYNFF